MDSEWTRGPSLSARRRLGSLIEVGRWMKFNAVGAAGIAVQGAVLYSLVHLARLNYLVSTVVAVEIAIVHNFIWHMIWTWRDRIPGAPCVGRRAVPPAGFWVGRLARFNLTVGLVSIGGNLVLMRALVGAIGIGVSKANLGAVAACSLLNFVISDRFVFKQRSR